MPTARLASYVKSECRQAPSLPAFFHADLCDRRLVFFLQAAYYLLLRLLLLRCHAAVTPARRMVRRLKVRSLKSFVTSYNSRLTTRRIAANIVKLPELLQTPTGAFMRSIARERHLNCKI